jgi:hypothetical protein
METSQLISGVRRTVDEHGERMALARQCVAGAALVIVLQSCCDPELARRHGEAFVAGYSDLKCVSFDPDGTTLIFSYKLPASVSSDAALVTLQSQVERFGVLKGSHPPSTCFPVVAKRADYLLMACDRPVDDVPYAWAFRVQGAVVEATTGPASEVLRVEEMRE